DVRLEDHGRGTPEVPGACRGPPGPWPRSERAAGARSDRRAATGLCRARGPCSGVGELALVLLREGLLVLVATHDAAHGRARRRDLLRDLALVHALAGELDDAAVALDGRVLARCRLVGRRRRGLGRRAREVEELDAARVAGHRRRLDGRGA